MSKANPAQPLSVGELLSALDACSADRSVIVAEARSEYVADLEQQLGVTLPTDPADILRLAGRLNDPKLSPKTRTMLAANMGRMAPLFASRQERMAAWFTAMGAGFDGCMGAHAGVAGCLSKAQDVVEVLRLALSAADRSDSASAGIGHVLETVTSEITAAQALLEMAGTHIGQPQELLRELVAEERQEAVVFCERLRSAAH